MKHSEKRLLEQQLRALGDVVPQIDLATIKHDHVVTPAVKSKRKGIALRRVTSVLCALCVLLLVIGSPIAMMIYDRMNTTTLYVEAVETAQLTVLASGKVKAVVYESAEPYSTGEPSGSTMLSVLPNTESLVGMQVEDAIDLIVSYMLDAGSIEQGCEVVISAVCKNKERGEAMIDRACKAVQNNEKVNLAQVSVVLEKVVEAHGKSEKGHSPAREKYLEELLAQVQIEYTREELERFSTGFLRFLCAEHDDGKDNGKEHHPFSDIAREYYEQYQEKHGKGDGKPNDREERPVDTSGWESAFSSALGSIVSGLESGVAGGNENGGNGPQETSDRNGDPNREPPR